MSEPQRISAHNSQGSFCSYRYVNSTGSMPRSLRATTSFVTVNHKRSFRPPPSILGSLVEYFPDRVPLAFATSSPAVRLFTESSGSRSVGHAGGVAVKGDGVCPRLGFVMDGFCITRAPTEPFTAPCDEGGVVEDDAPVSSSVQRTRSTKVLDGASDATSGSFSLSSESPIHIQAYPYSVAYPYLGSQTSAAEQHYYPLVGCDGGGVGSSMGTIAAPGRSAGPPAVVSGAINGGTGSGGAGRRHSHRHNSGRRPSPPPPPTIVPGGPAHEQLAAELHLCDSRCWHGGLSDLSLCASLCCSSAKGLTMALFSAWWLSRYYGIALTVKGFHQRDHVLVLKEIVRVLAVKELTCIRCTLSQEWMQTISTCSELVSLSFIGCEADAPVPLMYVDSILTTQARVAQLQQQQQQQQQESAQQRLMGQSKWYLSGILPIGLLRHLKCLHLVHTPVKQEFLEAVGACATNLECLILHRSRGITSLEPVAKLKNLRSLSIQSSSIDERGVEGLGLCSKLQRLYLVECRRVVSLHFLTGDVSKSLKQLTLSHNWFSEEHMRDVAACTGLIELHLFSLKRLTSVAPLSTLQDLEVLSLADTAVTVEGTMEALRSMRLTRVNMSSCPAITSVSAWLSPQSTTLTSLDLCGSGVDEDGLQGIASCAVLRYLSLADCARVTSLLALKHLTGLRWLDLSGTGVSDADLSVALNGSLATTLRYLSLRECNNVRHISFMTSFASPCHKRSGGALFYLDLENTLITDADVVYITSCTALKFLNMSRCTHLKDMQPLVALRRLRELDLSHTGITNRGLGEVAGCVSLQVLDLCSCRELTSLAVLAELPCLRELRVDHFGRGRTPQGLVPHPPASQPPPGEGGPRGHRRSRSPFYANETLLSSHSVSPSSLSRPHSRPQSTHSTGSARSTSSRGNALPSPHFGNASPFSMLGRSVTSFHGSEDSPEHPSSPAYPASDEWVPLSALGVFSCRRSALSEAGFLSLLAASRHLTRLDITECHYATDLRGLECLQSLRELVAAQCTRLHNGAVWTMSQLPLLECVSIFGCANVTSLSPLCALQNLKELDASATKVTDDGLSDVGRCVGLNVVCLADCRYVTSVRPLAQLPFLRELHLESTSVTDAGVVALASCPCLQRLFLTKCKRITDVTELAAALKRLEVLDIYGTSVPSRVAGEPRSNACSVM